MERASITKKNYDRQEIVDPCEHQKTEKKSMLRICRFIVFFCLVLPICAGLFLCSVSWGLYRLYHVEDYCFSFLSPCLKYRVDYYKYYGEFFRPVTPGNGSDQRGCFYIFRRADNKMLCRDEVGLEILLDDLIFLRDPFDDKYVVLLPEGGVVTLEE